MEAAGVARRERYDRAGATARGGRPGPTPRLSTSPALRSASASASRSRAPWPTSHGLILADEPTGELHSEDKAQVIELFRRFHRQGRTIVIVTHDPDVGAIAERRIEIRDGRVKELVA